MKKTRILCVLDGFGLSSEKIGNPFWVADIPNFRNLFGNNIWATLNADGSFVGQEAGLVGNSEVGHMNMGALKMVKQLSIQITESSKNDYTLRADIPEQKFDPKTVFVDKGVIHMIGLFSVGTIHSDMRHWAGAIKSACEKGMKIYLHLISDGRDSERTSFLESWKNFVIENQEIFKLYSEQIFLGSIGGRLYAMDRDNNIDRVDKYFNEIIEKNTDIEFQSILSELAEVTKESYSKEKYDEYILPKGYRGIQKGDFVWFLNFRTDRMKQIVKRVCDYNKETQNNNLILSNNNYGISDEQEYKNIKKRTGYYPIFENNIVKETLSEYVSKKGLSQLHIAETEKYNHVTYFFNGGSNNKQDNEDWIVIDSNKVENHGDKPEMKTKEVVDYIIKEGIGKYDYIFVNLANGDMVGHSGDFSAGVKALEVLDHQVGRLVGEIEKNSGNMIITADHGNIESVGVLENNEVDTKHNANPVPMIFIGDFDIEKTFKKVNSKLESDAIYLDQVKKEMMNYQNRSVSLEDGWLQKNQIPEAILPLWYVSLFLINL